MHAFVCMYLLFCYGVYKNKNSRDRMTLMAATLTLTDVDTIRDLTQR